MENNFVVPCLSGPDLARLGHLLVRIGPKLDTAGNKAEPCTMIRLAPEQVRPSESGPLLLRDEDVLDPVLLAAKGVLGQMGHGVTFSFVPSTIGNHCFMNVYQEPSEPERVVDVFRRLHGSATAVPEVEAYIAAATAHFEHSFVSSLSKTMYTGLLRVIWEDLFFRVGRTFYEQIVFASENATGVDQLLFDARAICHRLRNDGFDVLVKCWGPGTPNHHHGESETRISLLITPPPRF